MKSEWFDDEVAARRRRDQLDQIKRRRGYQDPLKAPESPSVQAKINSRRLAGAPILLDLVGDRLAVLKTAQTGALDRGDVDEHVAATIVGLDEAKALGRIEPLHHTRPGAGRLAVKAASAGSAADGLAVATVKATLAKSSTRSPRR